jgi:YfiR/HmsC-like
MRKIGTNIPLRVSLAIAFNVLSRSAAEPQIIDEYQVKAAFLFNFTKFVEWPQQAFKNASDPMSICVLGSNPFGNSLEEAVNG